MLGTTTEHRMRYRRSTLIAITSKEPTTPTLMASSTGVVWTARPPTQRETTPWTRAGSPGLPSG